MVWGNRRIYRQGLYGGVDGDVGGRWVWATVSFKQQFTWHDTSGFGRLYASALTSHVQAYHTRPPPATFAGPIVSGSRSRFHRLLTVSRRLDLSLSISSRALSILSNNVRIDNVLDCFLHSCRETLQCKTPMYYWRFDEDREGGIPRCWLPLLLKERTL